MGSEVKFIIFVWLLTIENVIFMSKIIRLWLRNCAPIQFLLLGIACGAIFDSPLKRLLKFPIIAHRHLCLDMFEGEGLKI